MTARHQFAWVRGPVHNGLRPSPNSKSPVTRYNWGRGKMRPSLSFPLNVSFLFFFLSYYLPEICCLCRYGVVGRKECGWVPTHDADMGPRGSPLPPIMRRGE